MLVALNIHGTGWEAKEIFRTSLQFSHNHITTFIETQKKLMDFVRSTDFIIITHTTRAKNLCIPRNSPLPVRRGARLNAAAIAARSDT